MLETYILMFGNVLASSLFITSKPYFLNVYI